MLGHDGDPGHRGVRGEVTGGGAVDQHAPLVRQQLTGDQAGEGRFPAAGGPQESQVGAGRHVQVHVVQHGPAAQAHRGPLEKDVAGDRPTGALAPGAVAQVHEHLPYATRGGSAGVDESG